jgi:A/G-specific adenine glycosylase
MAALSLRADDLPALRRALLAWHRRHALEAPWRASGDPYQALVAAVMAQQTQMSRVLPKFGEFTTAFPTVEALASASTADVLRGWAGLGYNLRALRLQRAAQQIVAQGGFPRRAVDLERIDGIGPFTAAIVASFAFGEPVAALDTNLERIIARLAGDVNANLPRSVLREGADALVARRAAGRWNQAMMDLGALVCTARSPACDVCPLARWCRGRRKIARREVRAAEGRARYRAQPPYRRSRRYYRGRIVDALRALPPGRSLAPAQLLERVPDRDGLDEQGMAELVEALRRDGLVRVTRAGRVRLP